ncbi:YczE/YyaS/YitT family protein [Macrococcus equipercicus]|uniref:YitT family protein n=1 Tax=Macrococcus equipercicus TaxID=69967 RepID=A0A9Q9BWB0_9STAP|nr:YitT family protein [Macrococcus equipercicus]KAA1039336.1 YitT family protein [Macrococcus equipercicus]UTH13627.1 YitT family protein [Macrococcus equipercicus]
MYRGQYGIRWTFFVTGLAIIGLGIALMLRGKQFGLSSWDVLHYGLWKQFGLSIGLWSILMGIVVVLLTILITRQYPRVGVFVNMLTIGTFIDIFNGLLPDAHSFAAQLMTYTAGIVIMTFGIALYITPQLGAGPRDTFMLLLIERTRFDLKTARTIMELVVLLIGWLLGGPVSVGTIIITFMLGPFIQLWLPYTRKLLEIWVKAEHAQ